ncbi:MAG: DUF2391 family protein [Candidatus Aenigmatarchaeota archaeon]
MFLSRRSSESGTRSSLVSRISNSKPDRFSLDDVAQQIVGAFLFAAPFSVTEEVWNLANSLDPLRLGVIIFAMIFVSTLIIFYTKFQRIARENIGHTSVPKRLVSVILVAYIVVTSLLWMFGVIGQITDPVWIIKLVIFISFFSSIGASAADIIK